MEKGNLEETETSQKEENFRNTAIIIIREIRENSTLIKQEQDPIKRNIQKIKRALENWTQNSRNEKSDRGVRWLS